MTTNSISSSSFIILLKKSIPLYSITLITRIHHFHRHNHLHACPLSIPFNIRPPLTLLPLASTSTSMNSAMSTFTTPPEFPTRRIKEVDPTMPPEIPQVPTEPDPFTVVPEPEIKPPHPPPDLTPVPPGPETPRPPIPSPPGPDIVPPPDTPPPRLPPDVIPPTPPETFPPPSTPPPEIIPPTGPMVV